MDPSTILVVDPSSWGSTLRDQLTALGHDAHLTDSLQSALRDIPALGAAYVITELRLGTHSALDLIRGISHCCPNTQVVVVTSYASISMAAACIKSGVSDVITRPTSADAVLLAFSGSVSSRTQTPHQPSTSLEETVRAYISEMLVEYGTISRTAKMLGVDRKSLKRMMNRYGVRILDPQGP